MINAIKYMILCLLIYLSSCRPTEEYYYKYNYVQQKGEDYRYYYILVHNQNVTIQYRVETDSSFQVQTEQKTVVYNLEEDTLVYQKWKFPRTKNCLEQRLHTVPLVTADLCKKEELTVDTIPLWKGKTMKVAVYTLKPDPSIVDIEDLQQDIYFITSLGIIWKQVHKNPAWRNDLVAVEEYPIK